METVWDSDTWTVIEGRIIYNYYRIIYNTRVSYLFIKTPN